MGPMISRQPHRSEGANSHGAWPSLRQMRSEVSLCTWQRDFFMAETMRASADLKSCEIEMRIREM